MDLSFLNFIFANLCFICITVSLGLGFEQLKVDDKIRANSQGFIDIPSKSYKFFILQYCLTDEFGMLNISGTIDLMFDAVVDFKGLIFS